MIDLSQYSSVSGSIKVIGALIGLAFLYFTDTEKATAAVAIVMLINGAQGVVSKS